MFLNIEDQTISLAHIILVQLQPLRIIPWLYPLSIQLYVGVILFKIKIILQKVFDDFEHKTRQEICNQTSTQARK
jgi:hypothetical protein